jgi:hypothetical protein
MSFREASANACNCILIVATLRRQPQFFDQRQCARFSRSNPLHRRAVAMASSPRLWESAGYSNQVGLTIRLAMRF